MLHEAYYGSLILNSNLGIWLSWPTLPFFFSFLIHPMLVFLLSDHPGTSQWPALLIKHEPDPLGTWDNSVCFHLFFSLLVRETPLPEPLSTEDTRPGAGWGGRPLCSPLRVSRSRPQLGGGAGIGCYRGPGRGLGA